MVAKRTTCVVFFRMQMRRDLANHRRGAALHAYRTLKTAANNLTFYHYGRSARSNRGIRVRSSCQAS